MEVAFDKDGQQRSKMLQEFKNEETERRKVHEELTFMKEEIKKKKNQSIKTGSCCNVSSAASTGMGPGSGTHARPPPLATR